MKCYKISIKSYIKGIKDGRPGRLGQPRLFFVEGPQAPIGFGLGPAGGAALRADRLQIRIAVLIPSMLNCVVVQ